MGRIALVLGVIAASIFVTSIFISLSQSTKTVFALHASITHADAINELGQVITSSPSLSPKAFNA